MLEKATHVAQSHGLDLTTWTWMRTTIFRRCDPGARP